jgi:hypothetical protein
MHKLFIVDIEEYIGEFNPEISEYDLPDEVMTSLHDIDEYLYESEVIEDGANIVYMCCGKLLNDRTDTSCLSHPIIACILHLSVIDIPIASTDIEPSIQGSLFERIQNIIDTIQERQGAIPIPPNGIPIHNNLHQSIVDNPSNPTQVIDILTALSQQMATPVFQFQDQLVYMRDMGFTNEVNIRLSLQTAQGNIDEAITLYMSMTET